MTLETKLRESLDSLDVLTRAAENELQITENAFRREFGLATDVQITEVMLWANLNARLKSVSIGPLKDAAEAHDQHAALSQRLKTFSGIEEATKLQTVIASIGSIGAVSVIQRNIESLLGLSTTLAELVAKVSKGFQPDVLEKGLQWIEASDDPHCPLCEQGIGSKEQLTARIRERLSQNSAYVSAQKSLKRSVNYALRPSKIWDKAARSPRTLPGQI